MPKLPPNVQAAAADSGDGFAPLPEGVYTCQLVDVATDRQGPKGPYWSWEFEVADGQDKAGRKLWVNTSLAENAAWKLAEVFTALGYSLDSDTDEMIGEMATLVVTQRVIEAGNRKGQIGNNVDQVLPYEGGGMSGDTDDVF